MLIALAMAVAPRPSAFIWRTWAASIFGGRPLYRPSAFAGAIPSIWRSFRRFVSNSANTPSMSRNALPAAVLVSTGCSVAFRWAGSFDSNYLEFRHNREHARQHLQKLSLH